MKRAKKKIAKKAAKKAKPVAKKTVMKAKAAKSAVKKPAVSRNAGQPGRDGTVTWNFKLLSHHHARRLRRHGRRHVGADRAGRPPHHLAGA